MRLIDRSWGCGCSRWCSAFTVYPASTVLAASWPARRRQLRAGASPPRFARPRGVWHRRSAGRRHAFATPFVLDALTHSGSRCHEISRFAGGHHGDPLHRRVPRSDRATSMCPTLPLVIIRRRPRGARRGRIGLLTRNTTGAILVALAPASTSLRARVARSFKSQRQPISQSASRVMAAIGTDRHRHGTAPAPKHHRHPALYAPYAPSSLVLWVFFVSG